MPLRHLALVVPLLVGLVATDVQVADPAAATADEAPATVVRRISGPDRVATSIAVARSTHPDGAGTVVLARTDGYADALAAAPLATALDAPLLLTLPDRLLPQVADTIRGLDASEAVLLGGGTALSPGVERAVTGLGVKVRRLAGPTRYATAARIAEEVHRHAPGDGAYVVEGANADPDRGWPDAVAVAGLAAATGRPILLTTRDGLPAETRDALERLERTRVTVVGGPASVSGAVVDRIRRDGATVERIAGPTRYATSSAVATATIEAEPDRARRVWMTTGRTWPDALAAGPAAARSGATLLLGDGESVGGAPASEAWLARHRDAVEELTVVGGERAVRPRVAEALRIDATPPSQVHVGVGASDTVAMLTGPGSLNRTDQRWGVHGTDLGHLFEHRGELRMVFGDTFGPGGFHGTDWRSNVMARIADRDPRDGLTFDSMVNDRPGHAGELLAARRVNGDELTVIPTNGVSVGGRLYLHYMSVRSWGEPGRWDVGHAGLAWSDDDGRSWDRRALWPDGSNFAQVAFVDHGGYVYLYGIPEGRHGQVRLARAPHRGLLDPSAYEYWTGSAWSAGAQPAAVEIVPGPVGELSVRWSPYLNRWLMTYLDVSRYAVVLRTSPRLVGPWDAPRVLLTGKDVPMLYGPYLVPGTDTDPDLYYTLSRFDHYNVLLARTRLEVTLR